MGRGLVEHDHRGRGEERSRQGDAPPFPSGDGGSGLADERVPSVRERIDPVLEPREAHRPPDLVVRRVRACEPDVLHDRRGEDMRILCVEGDRRSHGVLTELPHVVAAEPDVAEVGIDEPHEQLGERALPGARSPDDRHPAAGRETEVDVPEAPRLLVAAVERCVVDLDRARGGSGGGVGGIDHRGFAARDLQESTPGAEGRSQRDRGAGERGRRLERRERRQGERGDEDPVEVAVDRREGGDGEHADHGESGDQDDAALRDAAEDGVAALQRTQLPVEAADAIEGLSVGSHRDQLRRPSEHLDELRGQLRADDRGPIARAAARARAGGGEHDPAHQQSRERARRRPRARTTPRSRRRRPPTERRPSPDRSLGGRGAASRPRRRPSA